MKTESNRLPVIDLVPSLLNAWRINHRATMFLVENIPSGTWDASLPNSPRKTIRSIAVHLHNSRCSWMKSLGVASGLSIPAGLKRGYVSHASVCAALRRSGPQMRRMLEAGIRNGGTLPGVSGSFYFGAMPRDVALFVGYALSHEAHHRGQILLIARETGRRLPPEVVHGLWQWSSRLKEIKGKDS